MSDLPQGYVFDRYTLRPAMAEDVPLATEWQKRDPFHAGIKPSFWVQQVSGQVVSFLLEETGGAPVFFFRLQMMTQKTVEIFIQFPPLDGRTERMRTMMGLKVGWDWLKKRLTGLGYGIVSFRSKNPPLIAFFQAQGFERSDDMLWYVLQPRKTAAAESGSDVRTNA